MTLHDLVRRLGGDLYAGGRRANIPAPGHSRADRSVSLLLTEGRVVIHSFGGVSWREVRAAFLRQGLIDGEGRLTGAPPGSSPPEPRWRDRGARRAAARGIWDGGTTIGADTPAGRHCLRRAAPQALARPQALRFAPFAPISAYRAGSATRPALLGAIRDPTGDLTAVEVVYLTAEGAVTSWLRTPRKTVGVVPPGSAVRLSPAAPEMLVGEGVFTTLSAMARFNLPGWALLSTGNLRRWAPPEAVRAVLIAADRGADGEASAWRLAEGLRRRGVRVAVRLPPPPFGDWNDWARSAAAPEGRSEGAGGRAEGRERSRPALEPDPCDRHPDASD